MRTTYKEIIYYNLKLIEKRKRELYEFFIWYYYFKYGLDPEHSVLTWDFGAEVANDPLINMYYERIEHFLTVDKSGCFGICGQNPNK